jgi:large subunit ribosomal protein L13
MTKIIDAKNMILGRLASYVAKQALLGENIDVVNCEQAIISGSKEVLFQKYRERETLGGPHWGPFFPKQADRFVRKAIRNMMGYDKPKGKEAFAKVMCWIGVPDIFKEMKIETFKGASADKLPTKNFVKVSDLMSYLKHKD